MLTCPARHVTITPSCWPLESMKSAAARRTSAGAPCTGRVPAWLPGVVIIWPAFFCGVRGVRWPGGRSGALMAAFRPVAVLCARGPGAWPGGRAGRGWRCGPGPAAVLVVGVPPAGRRRLGGCGAGFDVLARRALGERAAAAQQDGELVVEVVPQPVGGPGAGLEPHGLPGLPQGGEPGDRLRVQPPLGAPAVLAADGPAVHGQEVRGDPVLDAGVQRVGRLVAVRGGRGQREISGHEAVRAVRAGGCTRPPDAGGPPGAPAWAARWMAASARRRAASMRAASGRAVQGRRSSRGWPTSTATSRVSRGESTPAPISFLVAEPHRAAMPRVPQTDSPCS